MNPIKIIRYDESNPNVEALKGQYGQYGDISYSLTIIKNQLFINLYEGCNISITLPNVHNGFITTSKNRIIKIKDSILTAKLDTDESASGVLTLLKWN